VKIATIFLSIWLAILSVQLCCECWPDDNSNPAISFPSFEDDSQEDCSKGAPFCVFSCCNGSLSQSHTPLLPPTANDHVPFVFEVSEYERRYSRDHSALIWQPPEA
jgi:hypothetical protein